MKSVLIEILTESSGKYLSGLSPRGISIDCDIPKVQAVIGPRRSGKSSLIKLAINQLLSEGIHQNQICYLPCEDERLLGENYEPDLVLQAFREIYPENPELKNVYFFFVEVQCLPKWENFINRVYEQISKNVVITGSNSKTIYTEVASVLRGRGMAVELLPLSFAEFLKFKNIEYADFGPQKAVILNALKNYMFWGGFPEIVLSDILNQRAILQEYFNTVIFRDIIGARGTSNTYIRYILHRIANNTGKTISLRKIYNELKYKGYAISQETIYNLADIAESVYLFRKISRFDFSMIKRENSDKKSYFIDNGMLHAIDSSFKDNYGMLFENLVFWHLYRKYGNIYNSEIYYYKDVSHECDFVVVIDGKETLPVQACFQINNEETRSRELKGLLKACIHIGSKKGIILTLEEESELEISGVEVKIVPAWKWFVKMQDLFLL